MKHPNEIASCNAITHPSIEHPHSVDARSAGRAEVFALDLMWKKHHVGTHKLFANHVNPQLRTRTVQYYKLPADKKQHAMSSHTNQSNIQIIVTTLRRRGRSILPKSCGTCLLITMYEHQRTNSWQQRTSLHWIFVRLPMAGKHNFVTHQYL